MNHQIHLLGAAIVLPLVVSSCKSLDPIHHNLPHGYCVYQIPYAQNYVSAGGAADVSISGTPGASADIGGERKWGYATYFGKCDGKLEEVSGAGSLTTTNPKELKTTTNEATKAIVDAGKAAEKDPAKKKETAKVVAESTAYFEKLAATVDLQPASGNNTPISVAISSLAAASKQLDDSVEVPSSSPNSTPSPAPSELVNEAKSITTQAADITR